MKFNHIPIKTPIMETAHEDNRHFYLTPEGEKLPSITTILHSFPNPGIDIWKSKTPNWKEIQEESFDVGTKLHSYIESYLKNEIPEEEIEYDRSIELFQSLKPELDKINSIQCLETHLFEPNLKIAGCTDCIAEFEGEKCIIDFKQSRKPKKESYIKDYKLQVTAYSKMFEYCTGQKIDLGVILIANWDGSTNVFKVNIPDYEEKLNDVLRRYYEMLSM